MSDSRPIARTLLVLGRASNLPTVWSNCLLGWLLGGGGPWSRFGLLLCGASLAYLGGMYLNDAFDADFDRRFRRERPIPSGAVPEALVWRLGGAMLAAGTILIGAAGTDAAAMALALAVSVVLYDWIHKRVVFSPVLMAACRLFLVLAAAASATAGITGTALWAALASAGWIVGLSHVARRESRRGRIEPWPLALLASPAVLAALLNDGEWTTPGIAYTALLAGWAGWCLRHSFGAGPRNPGRTVAGLLAGICLVDLLLLTPGPGMALVFAGLFGASLLGQRFVPAT